MTEKEAHALMESLSKTITWLDTEMAAPDRVASVAKLGREQDAAIGLHEAVVDYMTAMGWVDNDE